MWLPLHCPTDMVSLSITALQCLNLGAFANEQVAPTPYSKFAPDGGTLPSKQAMLVIYVPAMLTSAACLGLAPVVNGREAITAAMLLIHFFKRVVEVLSVHSYSGTTSASLAGFIGTFYALISLLVATQQTGVPASLYDGAGIPLAVSLSLFLVGELGNLSHHMRLAALRRPQQPLAVPATPSTAQSIDSSDPPKRKYIIPSGGGFDYVTMPHYTFELCAWLGIALCAQQINALLAFAGMASYLSGRAMATTRWYQKEFGGAYPKERRHLIPFLF